jgi:hypothetical protein
MMRKGVLTACAALSLAAALLSSSPARAMAIPAPAGLDGAVKAIDVMEQTTYYGPYGRRYYRPYAYRPYYRPYAYRPYYRPYAYRPYAYDQSYYYRPIYRPYPVFVARPVVAVPFPVPVVVTPWWGWGYGGYW